jgi:DNA-binding transcriptional MerR regulator
MGLKDVLGRMKLVELEDEPVEPDVRRPAASPSPPPAPRRSEPGARASIGEILRKVPPPPKLDEQALPKAASDPIPDFAAIYSASGVAAPAHGFSAEKVLEILSSPDFASLDARAKAAALAGFLRMNPAGPVPIADVIQDAVMRDQALDKFEEFLRRKAEARREQIDAENAALQAEIDALTRRNQQKMDENRRALEGEGQRLSEWQARKRIEERRLFDAVAPFVEQNPVSVGSADAPPAPGPGAKS